MGCAHETTGTRRKCEYAVTTDVSCHICSGHAGEPGRHRRDTARAQHGGMNKSILDPAFRYRPSHDTDVRKTFERVRAEMQHAAERRVVPLKAACPPRKPQS
jgi:hypothetical protein